MYVVSQETLFSDGYWGTAIIATKPVAVTEDLPTTAPNGECWDSNMESRIGSNADGTWEVYVCREVKGG